jgi:hypothetical protein
VCRRVSENILWWYKDMRRKERTLKGLDVSARAWKPPCWLARIAFTNPLPCWPVAPTTAITFLMVESSLQQSILALLRMRVRSEQTALVTNRFCPRFKRQPCARQALHSHLWERKHDLFEIAIDADFFNYCAIVCKLTYGMYSLRNYMQHHFSRQQWWQCIVRLRLLQ